MNDIEQIPKVQIVATIGPASKDKEIIKKMIMAGMDVARLNFSHGTHEEHGEFIKTIREAAQELNTNILIIQDLSGPRMSTADGHKLDTSAVKVITEKDLDDLTFGLGQNVDYAVLSYVATAADIEELRSEIIKRNSRAKIIAKIERREGVNNIEEIIKVSDAIMIGRGDLGLNVPVEEIPFIQKDIIHKSKEAGKPVITATHMLLSMTDNIEPTRAEVSDVSNAVLDGSDAVMLSEETARGKYPVEAVAMMNKIVQVAERNLIINTL